MQLERGRWCAFPSASALLLLSRSRRLPVALSHWASTRRPKLVTYSSEEVRCLRAVDRDVTWPWTSWTSESTTGAASASDSVEPIFMSQSWSFGNARLARPVPETFVQSRVQSTVSTVRTCNNTCPPYTLMYYVQQTQYTRERESVTTLNAKWSWRREGGHSVADLTIGREPQGLVVRARPHALSRTHPSRQVAFPVTD